jgi:hypothetical protein
MINSLIVLSINSNSASKMLSLIIISKYFLLKRNVLIKNFSLFFKKKSLKKKGIILNKMIDSPEVKIIFFVCTVGRFLKLYHLID